MYIIFSFIGSWVNCSPFFVCLIAARILSYYCDCQLSRWLAGVQFRSIPESDQNHTTTVELEPWNWWPISSKPRMWPPRRKTKQKKVNYIYVCNNWLTISCAPDDGSLIYWFSGFVSWFFDRRASGIGSDLDPYYTFTPGPFGLPGTGSARRASRRRRRRFPVPCHYFQL